MSQSHSPRHAGRSGAVHSLTFGLRRAGLFTAALIPMWMFGACGGATDSGSLFDDTSGGTAGAGGSSAGTGAQAGSSSGASSSGGSGQGGSSQAGAGQGGSSQAGQGGAAGQGGMMGPGGTGQGGGGQAGSGPGVGGSGTGGFSGGGTGGANTGGTGNGAGGAPGVGGTSGGGTGGAPNDPELPCGGNLSCSVSDADVDICCWNASDGQGECNSGPPNDDGCFTFDPERETRIECRDSRWCDSGEVCCGQLEQRQNNNNFYSELTCSDSCVDYPEEIPLCTPSSDGAGDCPQAQTGDGQIIQLQCVQSQLLPDGYFVCVVP